MANCCFGCVVRSLWLWNVDDGAGHAAYEDHAAACSLSCHQVFRNAGCKKVGSVDIDTPKLLHAFVRITDSVEVLGESGRGDEVVDLAVSADDVGEGRFNSCWVGNVTVVSCYVWNTEHSILFSRRKLGTIVGFGVGVVLFELFDNAFG